jgi:hypothetical protein
MLNVFRTKLRFLTCSQGVLRVRVQLLLRGELLPQELLPDVPARRKLQLTATVETMPQSKK